MSEETKTTNERLAALPDSRGKDNVIENLEAGVYEDGRGDLEVDLAHLEEQAAGKMRPDHPDHPDNKPAE